MEGSAIENTDQDLSAADEVVGDLVGQTRKLGEGEGQACAERELQEDC